MLNKKLCLVECDGSLFSLVCSKVYFFMLPCFFLAPAVFFRRDSNNCGNFLQLWCLIAFIGGHRLHATSHSTTFWSIAPRMRPILFFSLDASPNQPLKMMVHAQMTHFYQSRETKSTCKNTLSNKSSVHLYQTL
jgi:hypothetical protein